MKELSGILSLDGHSLPNSLVAGLTVLLAWFIVLCLYRLYFSPTAHFPGPKLAALTQWYEVYYDVYLNGQFTLHVKELHKKSHCPNQPLGAEHQRPRVLRNNLFHHLPL